MKNNLTAHDISAMVAEYAKEVIVPINNKNIKMIFLNVNLLNS